MGDSVRLYGHGTRAEVLFQWQDHIQPAYSGIQFGLIAFGLVAPSIYVPYPGESTLLACNPDYPVHFGGLLMTTAGWWDPARIELLHAAPVPEPATFLLIGAALVAFGLRARRRQ